MVILLGILILLGVLGLGGLIGGTLIATSIIGALASIIVAIIGVLFSPAGLVILVIFIILGTFLNQEGSCLGCIIILAILIYALAYLFKEVIIV